MTTKDDCDDSGSDPKTGGFDKPGAGKDDQDDSGSDPKTGGFDKPASGRRPK
ncbi:MAG TPA: hypothetical protein VGG06_29515 [Thermoanaerobaculia bacterium]|jgi:hypothetical protein